MSGSPIAYITTPIYYVNDKPHIGHVYTTTLCDVWARFQRFRGCDVFFLTGTDEHGVKVQESAVERGIDPQQLADENAAVFRDVMGKLKLTNDDFIRTTQKHHEKQVQAFVSRLIEKDVVYLGEFEGWYDRGEEAYYTETKARELDYCSPVSGRKLVRATEKNYFFRLSAFQSRLEQLFEEQPHFVRPSARRNEVLGRLREGLNDVPMSRTNFTWGIPMPGDPEHVIYVWIEALMNYITGLGLGDPESDRYAQRSRYWPATFQVMGKEIIWFHAVIWPAVLMALDLPLPRCVYAHSFWISEGQKMSKSLGNFVDLAAIDRYVEAYSLDMWRYYMISNGPAGATDADLSAAHFHETYNTDLVNTLGNCASRVSAMICKYYEGVVPNELTGGNGPRIEIGEVDWPAETAKVTADALAAMDEFDLSGAVGSAMSLIRRVDGFINHTAPFKLAKDPERRDDLGAILYQCAEAVRIASVLLWAVMPDKIEALWTAFGQAIDPADGGLIELTKWGGLEPGTQVEKVALFPRVEAPLEPVGAS